MQLYALDVNAKLVFARQAQRHYDYYCLECHCSIRLRKGAHRQPHYYHTTPNRSCRQDGKGLPHLLTQYLIRDLLPTGQAQLEYRFPEIGRVADVVWFDKKLIFEVQYSPITAEEIVARNHDYASVGYHVIWILSDQRYNQKRVSSAEDILKKSTYYFTSIDEAGAGEIYDQLTLIDGGKRSQHFPKLKVDLSTSHRVDSAASLPSLLRSRGYYFSGDYIHSFLNGLSPVSFPEPAPTTLGHSLRQWAQRYFVMPYRSLLHLMLERGCR